MRIQEGLPPIPKRGAKSWFHQKQEGNLFLDGDILYDKEDNDLSKCLATSNKNLLSKHQDVTVLQFIDFGSSHCIYIFKRAMKRPLQD